MQVSCSILATAAAIIYCIILEDVSTLQFDHPPSHASYAPFGGTRPHAGAFLSDRVIVTTAQGFWLPKYKSEIAKDWPHSYWLRPANFLICLIWEKIMYFVGTLYRHRCYSPYDKYMRNDIGLVVSKARMNLKEANRKVIPICDGSGDYTQATILHHQGLRYSGGDVDRPRFRGCFKKEAIYTLIPMTYDKDCQWSDGTKIKGPAQFCYKAPEGESSSCQGGHGEPLVAYQGTASECLLGITLMGKGFPLLTNASTGESVSRKK